MNHLKFIRGLPCLICQDNTSTEACHVRMADGRIGKPNSGLGKKPPDWFTVPLCSRHHRDQHSMGERLWWTAKGLDPILIALALYAVSGNQEAGERVLASSPSHFR